MTDTLTPGEERMLRELCDRHPGVMMTMPNGYAPTPIPGVMAALRELLVEANSKRVRHIEQLEMVRKLLTCSRWYQGGFVDAEDAMNGLDGVISELRSGMFDAERKEPT